MHTQEGPALTESDCGRSDNGPVKPLIDIDGDSGFLQDSHSHPLEPIVPLPNEQSEDNVTHAPGGVITPTVPNGIHSRNTGISIWKCVIYILMASFVFAVLHNAIFDPLPEVPCKLPVLSGYFSCCTREHAPVWEPTVTPDFITLARLQSRLEYVMEDSASNYLVAVNIKCSELALRDLIAPVKIGSLSFKDALEQDLDLFVQEAKTTSGGLQEFGSLIWAAADQIIALNEYTFIMLESGKSYEKARVYFRLVGDFVRCNDRETIRAHQKLMEDLWLQETELLAKTLVKLIHQVQDNIGSLQGLKERLDNIQDIVAREEHSIHREEQAFERQWFDEFKEMFGINQEKRQAHSNGLELLRKVNRERERALDYTTRLLFKLEQMSRDLVHLGEEAGAPIIAVGLSKIPIETHISSLRGGTERLLYGQTLMRKIDDTYRRKRFCSHQLT